MQVRVASLAAALGIAAAALSIGVTPAAPGSGAAQAAPARAEVRFLSNGGRYSLAVSGPAGGFETGKALALDVRVEHAAAPGVRVDGIALLVDADMPEHLHGINRAPRVERRADGSFRVENLFLHMPGWWEIFLDVVEGPWTERAQWRVELD
ncbi:MAG: hypothetical protein JNK02_14310 [Planctomycetes bacterium]|nr:hypothetical protein [Planctomycetota bacterium]